MKLKTLIRKEEFLKYLVEALIVMFGVLMGFYLTQRSSQKKIDKNTKRTLTCLIGELEYNVSLYESAIE